MSPIDNRVTARFVENAVISTAVYSPCKNYRYSLSRAHKTARKSLLFILLNPSTATEKKNDPTIARCEQRAKLLGYKSFIICNLFAYRTKSPLLMKNYHAPIGSENNQIIEESLGIANQVICAWGNHGTHLNQAETVMKIIETMGKSAYHLGLTKRDQPIHPLYVHYNQKPILWKKKKL